ncbi:MAG: hypothetical protein LBT23_02465, partial [Synergistaceae bacterium]|jgi:hypothetical protein|nr:hypothetical protein [Synergistaceae bacterium]
MACASLFPRARFGLKNDVFSGLLLFELLAATMDVPEAPPREAPAPKPRKREAVITAARGDVPVLKHVTPPPAVAFQSSGEAGDTGDLPDVIVRLMKEDLPLAAALIHARVYRSENSMSLDLADAPHAAAALLAGPRARAALERAFGFEPSEAVLGEPPEAKSAVSREAPARAAAPPSSAEAISVRMGADILMSRRLDTEESTETGDIEDEQIG